MATLAHPTTGEFGKRNGEAGVRATLERAVDAAPSHIRPPRSRLRRLFARDRSARALIERYRLWPAIEHAYARITREYGPVRVGFAAEDDDGERYVAMELFCDVANGDELYEFESAVNRESSELLGKAEWHRLRVFINPPFPYSSSDELRS